MSVVNFLDSPQSFPTFPVRGVSSGSVDTNKDPRGVSRASLIATGARLFSSYGSAEIGGAANNQSYGSRDIGKFSQGDTKGAFAVSGLAFRQPPQFSLDLQTQSLFAYSAYYTLTAYFVQYGETKGAVDTQGRSRYFASGGETIRKTSNSISLGVLTLLLPKAVAMALASIRIGSTQKTESGASLEVTQGDGLEYMVDIINAILYGGHGDDC